MYRPYSSNAPNSNPSGDAEFLIRERCQDLCTAFNTGNYDHMAALYAPDSVYMPPHREAASGAKAIERLTREYGEMGYQDLRLETTRIEGSGDLAVEIGRYSVSVRQPNGTMSVDHGKYLRVWRRLGAWLIVADSWNSNLPSASEEKQLSGTNRPAIISPNVPKSA